MRFGSYLVLFSQEESALAIVSGAEGGEQSLDRLDSLPQSWHLAGHVLPSDSFRSLLSAASVTRPDLPLCPGWALPTAETVPTSPARAPLSLSHALG